MRASIPRQVAGVQSPWPAHPLPPASSVRPFAAQVSAEGAGGPAGTSWYRAVLTAEPGGCGAQEDRGTRLGMKTTVIVVVPALVMWALVVFVNIPDFVPEGVG